MTEIPQEARFDQSDLQALRDQAKHYRNVDPDSYAFISRPLLDRAIKALETAPSHPTPVNAEDVERLSDHLTRMIEYADRYRLGDLLAYKEWRVDLEAARNDQRRILNALNPDATKGSR